MLLNKPATAGPHLFVFFVGTQRQFKVEDRGEMEATTDVMDVTWVMETTEYNENENPPQQPYYELYTAARFITGLILYPIICLFGLTGNLETEVMTSGLSTLTLIYLTLKSPSTSSKLNGNGSQTEGCRP